MTRKEPGSGSGDPYAQALRDRLWRYLYPLPWTDVREILAKDKALLDLTTERVIPAWIRTPMPPEERVSGGTIISLGLADRLIFERVLLTLILPVKTEFLQAFENYAAGNQANDPRAGQVSIWRSRSATLTNDQKLTQV